MKKIVLLRHGESIWNKENRFTGWTDVDLTSQGVQEAKNAGQLLKKLGYSFDIAYTSVLKRAIRTLWLALDEMDQMWIPIEHTWRLNERHNGALQGLNKAEIAAQYGEEQVLIWRRGYDATPPALTPGDSRYPGSDPRYKDLTVSQLPLTECLRDTVERFLPYWETIISPQVKSGKSIIIAAHGNSLRALVQYLNNYSEEEILNCNIPTGIPLVYELDDNLKPIQNYYLGNSSEIQQAIQSIANQAKTKS